MWIVYFSANTHTRRLAHCENVTLGSKQSQRASITPAKLLFLGLRSLDGNTATQSSNGLFFLLTTVFAVIVKKRFARITRKDNGTTAECTQSQVDAPQQVGTSRFKTVTSISEHFVAGKQKSVQEVVRGAESASTLFQAEDSFSKARRWRYLPVYLGLFEN